MSIILIKIMRIMKIMKNDVIFQDYANNINNSKIK